jgi:alkylhydroperoxidase family enzyme
MAGALHGSTAASWRRAAEHLGQFRDGEVVGRDEALDLVAVTEATFADVARRLSPREVVELLVVIGQYHAMAILLKSTALEPQPPLSADEILQARARRAALAP